MNKEEEDEILLELYLNTCRNLENLTEILCERGWTHAELAVHFHEHRKKQLER